jgi:hypothetical protein
MRAFNTTHFSEGQAAVPVFTTTAVETLLATSLSSSSEMLAGRDVASYVSTNGSSSGSVLGQLRGAFAMPLRRSDYFHLLPVVRELVAAIQTRHVGAGQSRGLGTSRCSANGHGKAVAGMAAAEKRIY